MESVCGWESSQFCLLNFYFKNFNDVFKFQKLFLFSVFISFNFIFCFHFILHRYIIFDVFVYVFFIFSICLMFLIFLLLPPVCLFISGYFLWLFRSQTPGHPWLSTIKSKMLEGWLGENVCWWSSDFFWSTGRVFIAHPLHIAAPSHLLWEQSVSAEKTVK